MKYTTLIALIMAIESIECEEQQAKKPKNVVVYVSSSNFNSASNRIDGSENPIVYSIIPQQAPPQSQPPIESFSSAAHAKQPVYLQPQPSVIPQENLQNAVLNPIEQATPNTEKPSSAIPSISQILSSLKETAFSINPVTISAGALLGLYAVYLIKLHNISSRVIKKNTWSTWKEHIPVEVMLEIPHQEVAEELFDAIKTNYLPVHNTDLMTPIVKFNYAVDQELALLNQFITMHDWLNYTKLSYIFPKHEMELVQAHTKIKRLVFLKDILLTWLSNYSSDIMHNKYIPRSRQIQEKAHATEHATATIAACI